MEWTGLTPREFFVHQRTRKENNGRDKNPTRHPRQRQGNKAKRKTKTQKAGRGQSTHFLFFIFGSYLVLEAHLAHTSAMGHLHVHPYASGRQRPHRRRCSTWSMTTESMHGVAKLSVDDTTPAAVFDTCSTWSTTMERMHSVAALSAK